MELLLGCGHSRQRQVTLHGQAAFTELVTLDLDPRCQPDVVHDLNVFPYPFADQQFAEVHAYEVLEHCGHQGDWEFFFRQWAELWRITAPEGLFVGSVPHPTSPWCWGDPGHTRCLPLECLVFLDQNSYREQAGVTNLTDYRSVYQADWKLVWHEVRDQKQYFALRARKP